MKNPFRSEAEMFRLVVVVGVGAAAVIAVALLTEPIYGAILLAVLAAAGIAIVGRRSRGAEPSPAEVATTADDVHRVLVVANETLRGRALLEEVASRCRGRESEILVVVPALASSRLEYLASDVDRAIVEARARLDASLAELERAGLRARGEVGDHHDPNLAIEDALRAFPADELIISTHPPDRSRWLERGVVERARRDVPLPLTHIVIDLGAETGGRGQPAEAGAESEAG